MEVVRFHLEMAKAFLNDRLAEQEPWKICLGSIGATLVANYVYGQITHKVKSVWHLAGRLGAVILRNHFLS